MRQEQQEAERLTAVIIGKRTSWKVREIPEDIRGQESGAGQGTLGLISSLIWPEELPFAQSFPAALPSKGVVHGVGIGKGELENERIKKEFRFLKIVTVGEEPWPLAAPSS